MFRGGGYAHRGTGITSGLVPVQRFDNGGEADSRLMELFKERQKVYGDILPESVPFDRFGANAPALMTLFSGMMSGKSLQGGLGGGLDILGQSLGAAAPQFGQAIQAKQKSKEAKRAEKVQIDLKALGSAEEVLAAEQKAKAGVKPIFEWKTLEDNKQQRMVSYDNGKNWKIWDPARDIFKPDEKTPLIKEKFLEGDMKQKFKYDYETKEWEPWGDAVSLWEEDPPGGFQYQKTFDVIKTLPAREPGAMGDPGEAARKVKQIWGLSAKEGVGDEPTKYDRVLLSEEDYIDGSPATSTGGNIMFETGPLAGKSLGGVKYNDGTTMYYMPTHPDANEKGLVNVADYEGEFEFFSSQATGKKEDIFPLQTKGSISEQVETIGTFSQTLGSGSNLLQQGKALGSNLDTFQRYILDTGGNILGQFGQPGDQARAALFEYFEQDPQALQRFIVDARTFAAQMIAPFTGEGSARISEPERELTNQIIALFDGIKDAETALSAIEGAISLTYIGQHRHLYSMGAPGTPDLYNKDADYKGFQMNEDAARYHYDRLIGLGLNHNTAQDAILKMYQMEQYGLQTLRELTNQFNSQSNDAIKDREKTGDFRVF